MNAAIAKTARSTDTILHCESLRREYHMGDETVHALDGVDLEIKRGEMVAVIGASGSGKSTLMNIIGCLDTPTDGRYWLDGHEVSQLSDDDLSAVRNRKIGFVFQQFHLLPRTSALSNVETPLFYRGEADARTPSVQALKRVGLGKRMHHDPSQLSGGQRQRVAVARALVSDPAIILADEPTGNLDSRTSDDIMTLFKELNEQGVTLVIVTHEPEIAAWCPRWVRMSDGKIVYDGPPEAAPHQSAS